jgi:hypothetical protein
VSTYGFSTKFEEFLPDVLPFVPNAPEFAAINAIRDAAIDFCQKTWYWQLELPVIGLKAGTSVYDLGLCPDQRIVGIAQVYYKDILLIPKGQDELARLYRDTNWKTLEGEPRYYTQRSRNEITLVPKPTKDDPASLYVRAAVAPTRDSDGIDAEVFEIFLEPIAHGARAILYNTPGQPYFDRVSARESDMEFRRGISEAKIAINKGMTRTSNRVEYQRIL